jgi:GDPmannose 4,6-dehydratase
VGRIREELQDCLYIGNLDAKRDWGFAGDYVEAMWLMLQQDQPDDYVIATGESHTVRELCDRAFARVGIQLEWRGHGVDEKGIERGSGRVRVAVEPRYFRPTEVDNLLGDASKARQRLGWTPRTTFEDLIDLMVNHDLELARDERHLKARR